MKAKSRQSGLTLMEQAVVIAAIALLVAFGLPAVRTFFRSIEARGGARAMISASLASARAIAAKEQHYAGIRFQNRYEEDGHGCQYMIFIVHDPDKTNLANGFRAVKGLQPIKLPDSVGVMEVVNGDSEINEDDEFTDKTTFSIIFSPSGKLVIHYVRVRNRDGKYRPMNPNESVDDIFNSPENISNYNTGMFVQDDYGSDGFQQELSRNKFRIYDKDIFEKVDEENRYDDYLKDLDIIYINPYTGTMINR